MVFMAISVQAQDLIIPKQGDPITAYNVEVSGNFVFYTTEAKEDAPIQRIAKGNVLMVRRQDGSVLNMTENVSAETESQPEESQFPEIKEEDIHGNLIAKGNCVYIPTDSPLDYEKAGQEQLKENMKAWGYWTVVDKPEQAHFVLQFTTQTSGEDLSFIIIRPRKYYALHPTLVRSGWNGAWTNAKKEVGVTANWTKSNEDINDNKLKAILLAEHLKRMILNPDDGDGKRFFKYHKEALDADNANNDSSIRCIYAS